MVWHLVIRTLHMASWHQELARDVVMLFAP